VSDPNYTRRIAVCCLLTTVLFACREDRTSQSSAPSADSFPAARWCYDSGGVYPQAALSPDGAFVLLWSPFSVALLDAKTGNCRWSLKSTIADACIMCNSGDIAIADGVGGRLTIIEGATGRRKASCDIAHVDDSVRLWAGVLANQIYMGDGSGRIWRLDTTTLESTLLFVLGEWLPRFHRNPASWLRFRGGRQIRNCAILPSGDIVCGLAGHMWRYDPTNRTLQWHLSDQPTVWFGPIWEGRMLVRAEGPVFLIDLVNGRVLREVGDARLRVAGEVACDAKMNRIIAGLGQRVYESSLIEVRSLATWQLEAEFFIPGSPSYSLSTDHAGRHVVGVDGYGIVRMWMIGEKTQHE